jgi:hypothetical protein
MRFLSEFISGVNNFNFLIFYRFQTDMLTLIMDHLVDADILIGEQAALPIVPGKPRASN